MRVNFALHLIIRNTIAIKEPRIVVLAFPFQNPRGKEIRSSCFRLREEEVVLIPIFALEVYITQGKRLKIL